MDLILRSKGSFPILSVIKLLCYWVIELLGYWVIGLLSYWVIGLLGYWVNESFASGWVDPFVDHAFVSVSRLLFFFYINGQRNIETIW